MEYFVETGRLARPVFNGVMRNGWTDALLLIRAADFPARGPAATGRVGGSLGERARRYSARKAAILNRLFRDDVSLLQDYEHLPVVHLHANVQALQDLLADEEVIAVVENRLVYPTLAQSLPLISADLAHLDGYTGENTSVAVIDSGVDYTHPAFGSCSGPGQPELTCKVAYAEDVAFDDRSPDDFGHGTHVAGIVLGTAPDPQIIALDVFTKRWYGPDDWEWHTSYAVILKAVDWVLAHRSDYAIAAVNLSMGSRGTVSRDPCPDDGLAPAITELKAAGILSAVAAGNDGVPFGLAYPACSPGAVSVGAVYDGGSGAGADRVANFSNSAYFLTLLAPGAEITATGLTLSGTSMAAPHVAGAAAVIKQQASQWEVDEIISALRATGTPVTDDRNGIVTPRIDLMAAIPVQADFVGIPRVGKVPFDVAFTDLSNPAPSNWSWSFGDGESATARDPIHSYATPGVYAVMLAADRNGFEDAVARVDYITAHLDESTCEPSGQRVRISNSEIEWFEDTPQGAYDAAAAGGEYRLDTYAVVFEQPLSLKADLRLHVGSGYGCDYATPYMGITITAMTISSGTAILDGGLLTLKPYIRY